MPGAIFEREVLQMLRALAVMQAGPATRCRRAALGLYRLADRLDRRQPKLAKRLRREAGELQPQAQELAAHGTGAALPPRHARALRHLLAGDSEKEIARKLGLSRHTVHEYVKAIYRRLGVGSRAQLVAAYMRDVASQRSSDDLSLSRYSPQLGTLAERI